MADRLAVELHALEAESGSGDGDAVDIGTLRSCVRGVVRVTTKTGNGSFKLEIETSPDGSTGWRSVGSVAMIAAGLREFTFDQCERFVRARWVLTGITAATFSVLGEAHVLYAARRDLHLTQLDETISVDDSAKVAAALLSSTDDAEDALNHHYPLPLSTWPDSLRLRCSAIARYRIMGAIGFQPEGSDQLIVKDHDDAQSWLRKVAERKIVPAGLSPKPADLTVISSGDAQDPEKEIESFSDSFGNF